MSTIEPLIERALTITRLIAAPRLLVFKAWTDPVHVARWWGPKGFTNPVCEMDVRPGGALRIVMQGPDGSRYPMIGRFREIVAPERLVFTNIAVGQAGEPLIDGLTTVTFEDQDGKTKLTLTTRAIAKLPLANKMIDGMEAGWTQSLDRLEGHAVSNAA
jgi:uncharacterized protein YndB with AHSA1/START domain